VSVTLVAITDGVTVSKHLGSKDSGFCNADVRLEVDREDNFRNSGLARKNMLIAS